MFFTFLQVFLAKWRSHTVVYNAMITPKHRDDFHHGLKMVANLQPNPEVRSALQCFCALYYHVMSKFELN